MAARRSGAAVILLAVVVGAFVGAVAAGDPAVAPQTAEPTLAGSGGQLAPETDNTITRILVHENGSATWRLEIRTRLENESEVESYRAFQDEFRSNTSRYLGPFRESITGIVAAASNATGREMTATAFRASTSIQQVPQQWGVVEYSFRWDGFAAVEGDRLRAGDVFGGGLFIAEGDAIEIVAPEGYRVESVDPEPDEREDRRVGWTGREDFDDGRPAVVLAPAEPAGSPASGGVPFLGPAPLAGGVVLLVLALGGGYWWRRRSSRGRVAGAPVSATGSDAGSGEDRLVTDEDRVVGLLEGAGGRMRQADVAEELEWSDSKTSRVLSRMAEEGTVEKLRIGRENVIDLAGGDGDA